MVLMTYRVKTTVVMENGEKILKDELAQEDLEIYEGEIPEEKVRKITDHITPFDIVSLSAYGKDLDIILKEYKGIRRHKIHGKKRMTWYGDDAKFIFMNSYWCEVVK